MRVKPSASLCILLFPVKLLSALLSLVMIKPSTCILLSVILLLLQLGGALAPKLIMDKPWQPSSLEHLALCCKNMLGSRYELLCSI
jgi:hypothetical protein